MESSPEQSVRHEHFSSSTRAGSTAGTHIEDAIYSRIALLFISDDTTESSVVCCLKRSVFHQISIVRSLDIYLSRSRVSKNGEQAQQWDQMD